MLLKSVNRDTITFDSFNLPANPITHAKEEINHHNGKFVMDKLNWTEISEDTNYPEIPDITLIEYIGEREKNLLMSILPIKSLIIRKTVMEQFNS